MRAKRHVATLLPPSSPTPPPTGGTPCPLGHFLILISQYFLAVENCLTFGPVSHIKWPHLSIFPLVCALGQLFLLTSPPHGHSPAPLPWVVVNGCTFA